MVLSELHGVWVGGATWRTSTTDSGGGRRRGVIDLRASRKRRDPMATSTSSTTSTWAALAISEVARPASRIATGAPDHRCTPPAEDAPDVTRRIATPLRSRGVHNQSQPPHAGVVDRSCHHQLRTAHGPSSRQSRERLLSHRLHGADVRGHARTYKDSRVWVWLMSPRHGCSAICVRPNLRPAPAGRARIARATSVRSLFSW